MTSLIVTSALSWPLQSQRRTHPNLAWPVTLLKPCSVTRLQAQDDAQARSESEALWGVMMRPA